MTGRLASTFIAEAGKPQKIYAVPAGKVFSGRIVVFNKTGTARVVQVKRVVGGATPTATFPYSNANRLGTSGHPTGQIAYVLSNGNVVPLKNTTLPSQYDLSVPEAPVESGEKHFSSYLYASPRTHAAWAVADRLVMATSAPGLRRYAGLADPWNQTTYGDINAGGGAANPMYGTGAGWGEYAIAFSQNAGYLCFTSSAPTTGSTTLSSDTFATLGLAAEGGSWAGSYLRCWVTSNGMFFIAYPGSSGNNYLNLAVASPATIGTPGGWSMVLTNYYNYSINSYKEAVFYTSANGGNYWILISTNTSYAKWIRIPAADILTQAGSAPTTEYNGFSGTYTSATTYGQTLHTSYAASLHQLADESIVWYENSGWMRLDPVTESIDDWVSDVGSQAVPANYANHSASKLSPVNIGDIYHTVPATGAVDTDNERIAYTNSGTYEFVSDDTWALDDIGDDSGWIDYNLALNDKTEVDYGGRMLTANDEIWVRSNAAGITVSVEGFLLDAA